MARTRLRLRESLACMVYLHRWNYYKQCFFISSRFGKLNIYKKTDNYSSNKFFLLLQKKEEHIGKGTLRIFRGRTKRSKDANYYFFFFSIKNYFCFIVYFCETIRPNSLAALRPILICRIRLHYTTSHEITTKHNY